MAKQLNLTEEQKAKSKALREKHRKEIKPLKTEIKALRKKSELYKKNT